MRTNRKFSGECLLRPRLPRRRSAFRRSRSRFSEAMRSLQYLNRALARFDLANQLAAPFPVFLRFRAQGDRAFPAPDPAPRRSFPAAHLPEGWIRPMPATLSVSSLHARLVAFRAHQEHVQIENLQFVAQRKVFPRRFALLPSAAQFARSARKEYPPRASDFRAYDPFGAQLRSCAPCI